MQKEFKYILQAWIFGELTIISTQQWCSSSVFVYTIFIRLDIYFSKRAFCSAGSEAISSAQIALKNSPFVAEKWHIGLWDFVFKPGASDIQGAWKWCAAQ